jgi:Fanconi anemia group M protein
MPSSPVKSYPVHSFFCGDHVDVDVRGYVSITFVPALLRTSELHKDTPNANWQYKVQNKTTPYKLTTDASGRRIDGAYSGKPICADNASNLDPHSPDYSEQYDPGRHALFPATPSKSFSSPAEKWDTPCNTKLASPALSVQEETELSPRLTHYIEEGIVPESPVLEVSHQKLETNRAADVCFVSKVGSSKAHTQGNGPGSHDGSLSFGEKGQFPAGFTEVLGLPRYNVLDQTQAEAEEPSNVKICSSAARTPRANLLCDSLSDDWQVKSVAGDTSGSVQQAPKYRRLCKYGEKIKRVPSMSLDERYDGYGGRQCDVANKSMLNQMEHARGELLFSHSNCLILKLSLILLMSQCCISLSHHNL